MNKSETKIVKDRKIYGNWQVESPDGILMFRCDHKKANWYLRRNLAEELNKNTIRLKFEPRGLGNHNKCYGLNEMENKCVNCGTDEFLTRHHVVPYSYRRYLPMHIKSHNFHDVLSMCVSCHEDYERKADQLKEKLAKKYEVPISGIVHKKANSKIVKYAHLILKNDVNIPKYRINEMFSEVSKWLGKEPSNEDLNNLISTKQKTIVETHGEIVVRKIDDIQDFIITWRKHFVDNNSLNHLPKNWKIENNIITDGN